MTDGTESDGVGQHWLKCLTPQQPRTHGHSLSRMHTGTGADPEGRAGQAARERRGGGGRAGGVLEGSTQQTTPPGRQPGRTSLGGWARGRLAPGCWCPVRGVLSTFLDSRPEAQVGAAARGSGLRARPVPSRDRSQGQRQCWTRCPAAQTSFLHT